MYDVFIQNKLCLAKLPICLAVTTDSYTVSGGGGGPVGGGGGGARLPVTPRRVLLLFENPHRGRCCCDGGRKPSISSAYAGYMTGICAACMLGI